jgi:hypothetical protein
MSDPGGADKVRYTPQEVLSRIYDSTENAIRSYLIAGVSIDPGDIQIGAVEIKNYDTDDRQYVDTDHYAHVRSVLRLYNGGSPVDVSGSAPVPTTITDALQGFSGGLWQFELKAEDINLITKLTSIAANTEEIMNNVQRSEGWDYWDNTSNALPANTTGITLAPTEKIIQVSISNDEVAPSVRTIEYSFNGGAKWATLKVGEVRTVEDIYLASFKLRSGDAAGGEAYRAEVITEV